jgi:TRAP-type C4-dicarboxylate transport system permease small subunit
MQKISVVLDNFARAAPDRSKLLRRIIVCIVAALLAPILLEFAALYSAQWREILGRGGEVHTPILDSVHDHLAAAKESFSASIEPYFEGFHWQPFVVLPVGGALIVLAIVVLKV